MYLDAIAGDHRDEAELVGLIEPNPGRLAVHLNWLSQAGLDINGVVTGGPEALERILSETRADRVIITSPDYTHAELIVGSLDAGADVVVEKPLTINPASTRQIAEAVDRTGRQVVVTHNYRYSPRNSALKEVIKSGSIGTPLSVTFEWVLDTAHGADYFRRWHRMKANSGGLLIHKASHHFDQLNWWTGGKAQRLFAQGGLRFYGAAGPFHGPRCSACPHADRCPQHVDLFKNPKARRMYQESESEDGYIRDGCVFDPGLD